VLEVVEERAVSEAIDDARERFQRADDAWQAITWAIARDPEFGSPLTESGKTRLAVIQGAVSIDLPTLEIVYETQDTFLVVHRATFSKAKNPEAGRA
jgi:hypothetical protein